MNATMENRTNSGMDLLAQIHAEIGDRRVGGWGDIDLGENEPKEPASRAGKRVIPPPLATAFRWHEMRKKHTKRRGTLPIPQAQPGEVPLGKFLDDESSRCGVSRPVVYHRVMAGLYPGLVVRRARARFVFLTVPCREIVVSSRPQVGETSLKEFVCAEADRNNETESAVHMRIKRGGYPELLFRRVNKRVVFVRKAVANV